MTVRWTIAPIASAFLFALVCPPAAAHFPFLSVDSEGHAVYHFGESIDDQTYKLPESIAKASVVAIDADGQSQSLVLDPVDSANLVGLRSTEPVASTATLYSQTTYGVYHGTKLDYHTYYVVPANRTRAGEASENSKRPFDIDVLRIGDDFEAILKFDSKPLSKAEVKLVGPDGETRTSGVTDQNGVMSFPNDAFGLGPHVIMVGHTIEGSSGQIGDQAYGSESHYLTATFDPSTLGTNSSEKTTPSGDANVSVTEPNYPPIPESVTSFGAAVSGNSLFVYGGHLGNAHSYDNESQGETLWRLKLDKDDASWQACLTGPPTQGLAMVATDGYLYRIGGFTARNEPGQEHDLWSGAGVQRIAVQQIDEASDSATLKWEELPALPEGRSSFDAAVVDGQIYVVGGWTMAGDADSQWLGSAYRLDPNNIDAGWQKIADPPFKKRALSCAAHQGRLYAVGGMLPGDGESRGGPTLAVAVYEPKTDAWTNGPSLVGESMTGFGSSSFATGGHLYVTTYDGSVQRLSEDGSRWEVIATLDNARFFHRMVPVAENRLAVIGGANMESGKFDRLEIIELR